MADAILTSRMVHFQTRSRPLGNMRGCLCCAWRSSTDSLAFNHAGAAKGGQTHDNDQPGDDGEDPGDDASRERPARFDPSRPARQRSGYNPGELSLWQLARLYPHMSACDASDPECASLTLQSIENTILSLTSGPAVLAPSETRLSPMTAMPL